LKLLFDENLSRKLPQILSQEFPDSTHVIPCGLTKADDRKIREYAAANGYVVVTQDEDFAQLCEWFGAPPKVIWIRRGNSPTQAYARLMRNLKEQIEAFEADSEKMVLVLD